jgi:hypothetical protein
MSNSDVDARVLDHIDLAKVNNVESSLNSVMNDATNSAHSENEASDEIARYFQKLLDRTGQRSSSSDIDTSDARHSPRKQPSAGVTSGVAAGPPEPLRDEHAVKPHPAPQPDVTDCVTLTANPVEPGPIARALLRQTLDAVPAEPATLPDAIRQAPKCDISTMRELANSSAHNAIALYGSKQIGQRAHIYLLLTVVAACISAVLYSIAPHYLSPPSFVATPILTLALILACRSQLLLRRARHQLSDSPTTEPSQLHGCKQVP